MIQLTISEQGVEPAWPTPSFVPDMDESIPENAE